MKILNVNYLENYKLEILFNNNETKIADFENFLITAKNPTINENLDKNKFKKVVVNTGFLSWNNGDMEIDAISIYKDFCN